MRRHGWILLRQSALVLAISLTLGGTTCTRDVAVSIDGGAHPGPPDIVLIVTDDQRWDTLVEMPGVRRVIGARGTTFREAFVVNPLCCPSRASILTGERTRTRPASTRTSPTRRRIAAFDDRSTIATWLDDAGYRTGFVGKYLNGYAKPWYVPPGGTAGQRCSEAHPLLRLRDERERPVPRLRISAGRLLHRCACPPRRAIHPRDPPTIHSSCSWRPRPRTTLKCPAPRYVEVVRLASVQCRVQACPRPTCPTSPPTSALVGSHGSRSEQTVGRRVPGAERPSTTWW